MFVWSLCTRPGAWWERPEQATRQDRSTKTWVVARWPVVPLHRDPKRLGSLLETTTVVGTQYSLAREASRSEQHIAPCAHPAPYAVAFLTGGMHGSNAWTHVKTRGSQYSPGLQSVGSLQETPGLVGFTQLNIVGLQYAPGS